MLFLLISLFFIQIGIVNYKKTLEQRAIFQNIEDKKVSMYINYRLYGVYGIRMLFAPAPIYVFFIDSCVVPDMISYVDSGERLKIYQPLKGKNIFELKKSGFTDFSGIILFFGTLLAILYGYSSFRQDEYLRFLSTLSSSNRSFFSTHLARLGIMFLAILTVVGSAMLLILFNGVSFNINKYFVYFILGILLLSFFFYSLGTLFSLARSKIGSLVTLLSCWFFLVFFVPMAVNFFVAYKSDNITPLYKLEMDKFKILSDFEKSAMEKGITYRYGEKLTKEVKDMVLSYWNNEFKKLEALEEQMREEMRKNISFYHLLSSFFPSTFYQSMTNEISSRGYENLLQFYKKVQELKRGFVKNYIDKLYFSNFTKVVSFIKSDENVYHASSHLPGYSGWGITATLFYTLLLFMASFIRYKKILYKEPIGSLSSESASEITLNNGGYTILKVLGKDFINRLYNILSGRRSKISAKGFDKKIIINNTDITSPDFKQDFLYLCPANAIPEDIRVKDFLHFICRMSRASKELKSELLKNPIIQPIVNKTFGQLEIYEKSDVLLFVLEIKKSDLCILYDTCLEAPASTLIRFKDLMDTLAAQGKHVLYLTSKLMPEFPINQHSAAGYRPERELWDSFVEKHKRMVIKN
jgi:ABC-type transport system involved in multi-copper enzyme maturation permease subunit